MSVTEKLAQREYKQRHDNIAKVVRWKLCEKYHLEKKDKWREHVADSVSKNDEVKTHCLLRVFLMYFAM